MVTASENKTADNNKVETIKILCSFSLELLEQGSKKKKKQQHIEKPDYQLRFANVYCMSFPFPKSVRIFSAPAIHCIQ